MEKDYEMAGKSCKTKKKSFIMYKRSSIKCHANVLEYEKLPPYSNLFNLINVSLTFVSIWHKTFG